MVFLLSSKAHARILNVDPSEALKIAGVIDFISYKDIPKGGQNCLVSPRETPTGDPDAVETIFCVDTVGSDSYNNLLC